MYRGDDAGDATGILEAQTFDGKLRAELAPRHIKLEVANRALVIEGTTVTILDGKRIRAQLPLRRIFVARDVPREDLGVWLEVSDDSPLRDRGPAMRRVFGVAPYSLMTAEGLQNLPSLDKLAARLRDALAERSGDIRRAVELGRGLDKVVLADHGDHHALYARRLFRDRARLCVAVHHDGRVEIPEGKTVRSFVIRSRYGVTLWGDWIRFSDHEGVDLGRVSVPWVATEDRVELARRLGALLDSPKG
ncbi:MAG TPA: hypothetical protein VLB06_12665 [Sulfuricaulis sp.]|nr:hypothetical protein [Sulfuricaulis sp.]